MPLVRVDIYNILYDKESEVSTIILKDRDSNSFLFILIDPAGAGMIARGMIDPKPKRPLTHDLLQNLLTELSYKIDSIEVYDLKDDTYYANINISTGNKSMKIDSRPSDAIALAVRAKCPIFAEKALLTIYTGVDKVTGEVDEKTLKEYLKNMNLEDAGGKIM